MARHPIIAKILNPDTTKHCHPSNPHNSLKKSTNTLDTKIRDYKCLYLCLGGGVHDRVQRSGTCIQVCMYNIFLCVCVRACVCVCVCVSDLYERACGCQKQHITLCLPPLSMILSPAR